MINNVPSIIVMADLKSQYYLNIFIRTILEWNTDDFTLGILVHMNPLALPVEYRIFILERLRRVPYMCIEIDLYKPVGD